ncbi:MAG: hypothetical protein ACJASK_002356, partial [Ilumatobacter sp.]
MIRRRLARTGLGYAFVATITRSARTDPISV